MADHQHGKWPARMAKKITSMMTLRGKEKASKSKAIQESSDSEEIELVQRPRSTFASLRKSLSMNSLRSSTVDDVRSYSSLSGSSPAASIRSQDTTPEETEFKHQDCSNLPRRKSMDGASLMGLSISKAYSSLKGKGKATFQQTAGNQSSKSGYASSADGHGVEADLRSQPQDFQGINVDIPTAQIRNVFGNGSQLSEAVDQEVVDNNQFEEASLHGGCSSPASLIPLVSTRDHSYASEQHNETEQRTENEKPIDVEHNQEENTIRRLYEEAKARQQMMERDPPCPPSAMLDGLSRDLTNLQLIVPTSPARGGGNRQQDHDDVEANTREYAKSLLANVSDKSVKSGPESSSETSSTKQDDNESSADGYKNDCHVECYLPGQMTPSQFWELIDGKSHPNLKIHSWRRTIEAHVGVDNTTFEFDPVTGIETIDIKDATLNDTLNEWARDGVPDFWETRFPGFDDSSNDTDTATVGGSATGLDCDVERVRKNEEAQTKELTSLGRVDAHQAHDPKRMRDINYWYQQMNKHSQGEVVRMSHGTENGQSKATIQLEPVLESSRTSGAVDASESVFSQPTDSLSGQKDIKSSEHLQNFSQLQDDEKETDSTPHKEESEACMPNRNKLIQKWKPAKSVSRWGQFYSQHDLYSWATTPKSRSRTNIASSTDMDTSAASEGNNTTDSLFQVSEDEDKTLNSKEESDTDSSSRKTVVLISDLIAGEEKEVEESDQMQEDPKSLPAEEGLGVSQSGNVVNVKMEDKE